MNPWFRRVGFLFVPDSLPGALITGGALAFLIHVFLDINRRISSMDERIISYFVNFVIVLSGYMVVGYFTSAPEKGE